jgi:hypothetical protein
MRAKEFISEAGSRLTKRQQQSSKGIHRYHDAQKADSTYVGFRLGQAVAMANGVDPIDYDAISWAGKNKTAHPYTEEEAEMLKQAYKAVGASWEDLNHGDLESKELDSINKFGPVPDRKKLKK